MIPLGCGGSEVKSETPGPGVDDDSAQGPDAGSPPAPVPAKERLVALFAALDSGIGKTDESCPKFTAELAGWLEEHGDEIRDLLIQDLSDDEHDIIDASIHDAATTVVFAASECGSSDDAIAAYDEFDALVL